MISKTEPEPHGKSDGGKGITMAMIAKAAGVSQGAISSLLNDRDYGIRVSAKTRERVFRVCREMGYIPNDLRAVVRMYPERGELCLLLDETSDRNPLADHFLQALLRKSPQHHVSLALYHPGTDYDRPENLPEVVRTGVASQFITLGRPNRSLFVALVAREFGVIHVGESQTMEGVSNLVPDYREAADKAVTLLFERGHRRIAILSGPFGSTEPSVVALNHGVRMAYDSLGIPIEAQNVVYGSLSFEHGASALAHLWERTPRPTALFCFSDLVAAGAIHRAQELGATIPADLSVIGCGDASFSPWLHPPLTTLGFAPGLMAEQALAEMHRRFSENDFAASRTLELSATVIERSSCAHSITTHLG